MHYFIKILAIIGVAVYGYLFIHIHKKGNVKNMDEFRKASLLKKIDMCFTEEYDGMYNNERFGGYVGMVMILIALISLIIDCFK